MKPAKNKYQIKETIGLDIIVIGTVCMFLGGLLNLYNPVFKWLICGGIAGFVVGILMAIINYVADKFNSHKQKNQNKQGNN